MKTQSFASLKASAPFFLFVCFFTDSQFTSTTQLKKKKQTQTQTHKTTDILEYKRNKKEKVTHQI